MNSKARAEWVTLALVPHIGGKVFRNLLDAYQTPKAILATSYDDLRKVVGVGPKIAAEIKNAEGYVEGVFKKLSLWERDGIQILTWEDALYPTLLKQLDDAPPILFARGQWTNPTLKTVAIVGTREPSDGVAEFTHQLAYHFASHGWTVVSGLAKGIDCAAHVGALEGQLGDYPTIAFLGNGVSRIYPSEHTQLANRIMQRSAIFSEIAPHKLPSTPSLVARNRLITGFSRAVIIVESGDPGGALHAARFARTQLRPVFTIDYSAAGNQRLREENCQSFSADLEGIYSLYETVAQY
ncbi:MAG: hypothetical protein CUN55_07355 [Phototrophicales bacterium]|nr:MAG: hypothetical protein CUN55_07355 [Phototrophicales bacterium]